MYIIQLVNNWIHIITYYYVDKNIIWLSNMRFMINMCCFCIKKKKKKKKTKY
jgi:hypothetical protein